MLGSLQTLYEHQNMNELSYTMLILSMVFTLKVFAWYQREKIEFHFNRSSKVMKDFLN
jgi:hypothetical protein